MIFDNIYRMEKEKENNYSNLINQEKKKSLKELTTYYDKILKKFLSSSHTDKVRLGAQEHAIESLKIINKAFQMYKPSELAISFNGGKDCLVMLVIILAALNNYIDDFTTSYLPTVYVQSDYTFNEVESFVEICAKKYYLDIIKIKKPLKNAFTDYLNHNKNIKAIFIGTRRTDPHGTDLTFFKQTDGGWPDFMRISPVLEWHYAEIWDFLLSCNIPYCSLYDKGYTSLGGVKDTNPNPALRDGDTYKPAYKLYSDNLERLGRV